MLPPLASLIDFADRIPGGVAASDEGRVYALINDASALVRHEAGHTWVNDAGQLEDVPDVAVVVTITAARRAFINPDGVSQESAEDVAVTYSNSPGVYLTDAEKALIAPAATPPGVWSLSVTRSTTDIGDLPPPYPCWTVGSGSPEEVDPFAEGWAG